jgi:hypothetical protein
VKKIIGTVGKGAKTAFTWLGQPLKTDELKAKLEGLRDEFIMLRSNVTTTETDLSSAINNLNALQAKFDAIGALTTEIFESMPPLEPDGWEAKFDEMKDKYYDPISTAYTVSAAVSVVAYLPVGAVHGLNWISGGSVFSKGVSGVGKMGKFLKGAKMLGKATVALSVVLFLVEIAIKLITAQKTNEELRTKIEELNAAVDELETIQAKMDVKIEIAEELLNKALREAGVDDPSEYLILLNEEIAAFAEKATYVKLARVMIRMGQPVEQIIPVFQQLDETALRAIELRIRIETSLVAGKTIDETMQATGASGFQVGTVVRILAVRADAVLGYTDDALARRHKVSDAVADMQINLVEDGLKKNWDGILGDAPLDPIAEDLLVSVTCLQTLRAQTPAKVALWEQREVITEADAANEDPELLLYDVPSVASLIKSVGVDFPDVPKDRLNAMVQEVDEQSNLIEFTKTITDEHAVIFRLPRNVLPA